MNFNQLNQLNSQATSDFVKEPVGDRVYNKKDAIAKAGSSLPPSKPVEKSQALPDGDGILSYVIRYRDACTDNLTRLLALGLEARPYELARIDFLRTEITVCQRMLCMFQKEMN